MLTAATTTMNRLEAFVRTMKNGNCLEHRTKGGDGGFDNTQTRLTGQKEAIRTKEKGI